jgi:hypothetical protein
LKFKWWSVMFFFLKNKSWRNGPSFVCFMGIAASEF